MPECTIKLEDKLLKPGSDVMIGPDTGKFKASVWKTEIVLYRDGTSQVVYYIEWWDDREQRNGLFRSDQVEECTT